MRRGLSKYIFLGTVLFIVLCILASPMSMGEVGQSFDVEVSEAYLQFEDDYDFQSKSDRDFFIQKGYTMSALSGNIEYMDELVGSLASTEFTKNITLGRDYVMSRTMFTWEQGAAPSTDDGEDVIVAIYWKDANELTVERFSADFAINIYFNMIEFTAASGVVVEEYGPYDTSTNVTVTSHVVGETLIISSGCTTDAARIYYAVYYFTATHLTNATTVELRGAGSTDQWANAYFQQVYVPGSTVQRGKDSITTSCDITVTEVDTARTSIFGTLTRITLSGQNWDDLTAKAHFSDSTSLIFEKVEALSAMHVWWQLIEWPDGWFVTQNVYETGMSSTDTSEATVISTVVTANSVSWKSGALAGISVGGIKTDENTDNVENTFMRTDITSTTLTGTYRSVAAHTTTYYVHVLEVAPNAVPVNDQTPVCTNLDDTDNLYARYKIYNFSVSATDADGATDIDYLELSSMNGATPVWTVKYTESDNSFSETAGTTLIELTGSVYTKSGVNLDIWFGIRIEWAHVDANDYDLKQYVVDDAADSDTDTYSAIDYDYDTDVVTTFTLNDGSGTADHGNYDSIDSITATGTVSYEDSGGNNYPPTDEADVFIECSDIAGQPWSDLTLSSGAWSMTVDSDDVTGTDIYWVSVVAESGGVEGTQYNSTSVYDEYIADALTITITGPTDNRQNLNANASGIVVSAVYDEGGAFDGTLTLNNTDYNGDGTVVRWGYTVDSASGDTYGVTSISTNDDTYMIWDRVQVQSYTVTDDWVNINDNVNIDFLVWYDYDNAQVTDGDFTLNGYDAAHLGSGVWRITRTSASPALVTYNTVLVSAANTHGIDVEDQNSKSRQVVWDSVTISMTNPTDQRQNLNANATGIVITITMDYNATAYGGTATMNNTDYDGDGSVVRWGYTVSSVNGGTEGITTISSNDETYMIWDSLTITITGPTDNRQNLNANASGIVVSAVRDYDSSAFDGTLTLNNTDYNGDGTAVRWGYTVDSPSGGTYGITTISSNDDTYMIWDSYTVSFTVDDNRININVNATVGYTVISDYDSIAYDGTVNLNYTTWEQATAQRQGFTVTSLDGDDTYAITSISTNDDDYVIWDSLTVSITNPTDQRININANASGMVISAIYDYDSTTYDGTLNLNDTDYDRATAIRAGYKISSADGDDTHGITVISDDSDETYCVWDSLTITITGPTDNRQNLNANASGIVISAVYDYDSEAFDGTFTLNNTDYNGDGTAVRWDYTVESVTGDTHGITTISSNDDTYMIWDSLTITITGPTDNRQNINANASGIVVSAVYDYDSEAFDGTFTLNNTDYNGDGTVVRWDYTVQSVTGDTHGITTISSNDDTYMIWDQIKILGYSTNSTDNRDNIGTYVNISVWIQYDYDDTNVTDGTIVINSDSYAYNAGSGNWTAIFSNATYSYATWDTVVAAGNTYGITSVNQNSKSQLYVWDEIEVYWSSVSDARTNIDEQEWPLFKMRLKYDLHLLNDGTNDGAYINSSVATWSGGSLAWYKYYTQDSVGTWNFIVTSASEDTYGITAFDSASAVTYDQDIIWDAIGINMWISDGRDNTDDTITVYAWLTYIYDRTNVTDGTVLLNGTGMSYGDSIWSLGRSQATAGLWAYNITSISGNTHGIAVIGSHFFDGAGIEYVRIPASVGFDGIPEMTVSAWVNPSLIAGDYRTILGFNGAWNVRNWEFSILNTGAIWFHITNGTHSHSISYGSVPLDTWSFVSARYIEGELLSVGINGVETSTTPNIDMTYTAYDMSLGSFAYGVYDWFNGYIDEVRLYNRSLSDVEIFELYQKRYSNDTGLVLHLNMASLDHVDNTWYDLTDNGHDGTIYGSTINATVGSNYVRPIWDEIEVYYHSTNDNRVNIDGSLNVIYQLRLKYDNHLLNDDANDEVWIEGEVAIWSVPSGAWYDSVTHSTVGTWPYKVTTASEDTYGITVLDAASATTHTNNPIWDRIQVYFFEADDYRASVDANVEIRVRAWSEYDKHNFTSGDSISVNGTALSWDAVNEWFEYSFSQSTVGRWCYNVTSLSEVTYGITVWRFSTGSNPETTGVYVSTDCPTDSQTWSFEHWYMVEEWGCDAGTITTYKYDAGGSFGFIMPYRNSGDASGSMRWYLHWNNTADVGASWSYTLTDHVAGVWYHTVATGNSTGYVRFYRNGAQFYGGQIGPDFKEYRIGDDYDINFHVYGGGAYYPLSHVDKARYYERELSASEVYQHYYGVFSNDANLLGRWDFDGNLTDLSGNGYDGSIVGGDYEVTSEGSPLYVVWDRVYMNTWLISDQRDNIGDGIINDCRFWLEYDDYSLQFSGSGVYQLNGYTMTWAGGSMKWYKTLVFQYVTNETVSITSVSDSAFSITSFTNSTFEDYEIWDAIGINMWIDDGRDDVDDTITVYAWLTYMYDATNVTDGTVLLNGTGMNYGSSIWSLGRSQSTAGLWAYNITSISGNAHGITEIGYHYTDGSASYTKVEDIDAYNSTSFTRVITFRVNELTGGAIEEIYRHGLIFLISYRGDWNNLWAIQFSSNDTTQHGINMNFTLGEWHTVVVTGESGGNWVVYFDGESVASGSNYEGILRDANSDIYIGAYGTTAGATGRFCNGTVSIVKYYNRSMTAVEAYEIYQGRYSNNTGLVLDLHSASLDIADGTWYDYSEYSNDGTLNSIQVMDGGLYSNYLYVRPIWDSLTITITGPTDNRQNLNANATGIIVSAVYDYGGAFDGTFVLNNTDYNGDGTVVRWGYTVQSVTGDTYGITTISTNDDTYMIWDRIYAVSLSYGGDARVDIGTSINFDYELHYDYDESDVSDGTITINGYAFADQGSGIWRYTNNSGVVGDITFDSIVPSGNTHGITTTTTDGNDITLVWDRMQVQTTAVTDDYINIDTGTTTVNVTIFLDYDNAVISGANGTVTLNDTSMTWNTDHWYLVVGPYTVFTELNFYVNSSTDTTYSITAFDLNGQSDIIGTDRVIVVSYYANDTRVNVDDYVRVYTQLAYESDYTTYNPNGLTLVDGTYDDGAYGDLASVNGVGYDFTEATGAPAFDLQMNFTAGAFQGISLYIYVSNAHGVHQIDLQMWNYTSSVWVFIIEIPHTEGWHWVNVTVDSDDGFGSGGQAIARLYHEAAGNLNYYYYLDYVALANSLSFMQSGTVTIEGYEATHLDDGVWYIDVTNDTVIELCYDDVAVSGNNRGITSVFNQTCQFVVWDSLTITITIDDNRIDINENATIIVTSVYDFDGFGSNCSYSMNDTTYDYGSVDIYYYTVSSVSGDVFGITLIGTNDADYVIFDRILILTTTVTDGRINYGLDDTTLNVTAELEYDSHALGGSDTLYMNGTSMTWDTDHFYLVTGIYSIVDIINYFVNSTSANEDTYGITVVNLDGNSANVIWDRIQISTTVVTDGRIDYGTTTTINVTATLEYAAHSLDASDALYMNDTSMTWDTDHFYIVTGGYNIVDLINYFVNSSSANEATHGITVINLDGNSADVIWDRIIILTTVSTDGRIDYGTTTTINVTASLEYTTGGTHYLGSGDTLYMNDTLMTWDTDHFYIVTDSYNIVDIINYFVNSSLANEATYDISVFNLDGINDNVIWDRILILTTVVTDGRIDYGTTTTFNVTAELEYDSHALGVGDTLYMNGTSMTWDTDHYYFTTGAYNIIDIINYFVNSSSANEATYGITVINLDGNSDDVIWDRIKILTTVTDDSRVGYDTQATIVVTAQLEYDYHVLGTGDTLYMNGTQMTWNGTHFILNPQFTDVDIWNFYVNSTSANEATYGITVISLDGNNVNQIWDRVAFTWNANMTWTIVTYYINVSFTATHEYDSATFVGNLTAGNCTITNSTTAYEILTESPYENYTYYTTSVLDDVYGITSYINTVTAWCVFDNITATESHGVTVTEYSKTFFIFFGELQWQYNGSNIGIDWLCLNMRNGTQTTTAITLADSILSPIKQVIYVPVTWDGVLYSNNATKTVGGRVYNFQWYTIEHSVMPSQTIVVENIEILDVTLTATGTTNVDFTWTIYDEGVATGETDSVSDANDFKIEFDKSVIYGWRNYSIYFDAGVGGDRWYNSSYFNYFDLRIEIPEKVGDSMEIKGTSNVNCVWYIYNRDTADWTGETDSIAGGSNYFQFLFTLQTASGKHNYSLYFNISATVYIWKNGSYYITPTVFDVDVEGLVFHDNYVQVMGTSNMDMAWYVYNEGVYSIGETGSELANIGFTFSFVKNTSVGKHNFSIYYNDTVDGTQYRWFNRSYTISTLYSYCDVVLYGPEGTGLNPLLFKILINGTEHTSSTVTFYGGIDLVHNVTVLNYFDEIVGSDINQMPDDKIIRISINDYVFKVYNQLDEEYIYYNMTSAGGAVWSEHIGPREVIKFHLYGGNIYTYTFTALTGPDVGTFTGSVNASVDIGMIITGYSLPDIYAGFAQVGGGGDLDLRDIQNALIAQTGGLLNQIQFFTWLTALMIFLGLYIVPYVSKQRKKGTDEVLLSELGESVVYEEEYDAYTGATRRVKKTKKKKGPVPEQLRDHTFKEGMFNPKFKGTRMLDEMGDEIWRKLRGEGPSKREE